MQVLRAHDQAVSCMSACSVGVATGGKDGYVKLWGADFTHLNTYDVQVRTHTEVFVSALVYHGRGSGRLLVVQPLSFLLPCVRWLMCCARSHLCPPCCAPSPRCISAWTPHGRTSSRFLYVPVFCTRSMPVRVYVNVWVMTTTATVLSLWYALSGRWARCRARCMRWRVTAGRGCCWPRGTAPTRPGHLRHAPPTATSSPRQQTTGDQAC